MREFGIIQDKFPGSENVYKDWAEASIANLSDAQREKLFGILNPKPEGPVVSDASISEVDSVDHITVDGDVTDVFDKIPELQRKDIEMGIQYVLEQGYRADLVLGRWAKQHTGGWESTVGQAVFGEEYNLKAHSADKHIPGSSNILLVLRVSPTGPRAATIVPELLEIPASGENGGRKAMITPGMLFHKPLSPSEFLEQLTVHKADLSIAA